MRLSIFTTVTNAYKRGDNARDAFACYRDLADEVIAVDGGFNGKPNMNYEFKGLADQNLSQNKLYSKLCYYWPKEFDWSFIGQQMQRGYEQCSGDWVIRADIDMLFHEKDFATLRKALEEHSHDPAVSLYKRQFILPDRFNVKSRLVVAVNKKMYGDRIRFDSGGDLCQPSLDGKELEVGRVPDVGVPIYNYEKLLKTEAQIKDDVGRMARAWQRHFGDYKLGGPDDESAYKEWLTMVKGRFQKPQEFIPLEDHPRFVQETIRNLQPNQWGYGIGLMERNKYVP